MKMGSLSFYADIRDYDIYGEIKYFKKGNLLTENSYKNKPFML